MNNEDKIVVDNVCTQSISDAMFFDDLDSGYHNRSDVEPSLELHADIPYLTVYDDVKPFDSTHDVFIPGLKINVRVEDTDRVTPTALLAPFATVNLTRYSIHLQHGEYEWTVRKRYSDFLRLHHRLKLFRATLALPLPTKQHRLNRETIRRGQSSNTLPSLSMKPETFMNDEDFRDRVDTLQNYFERVLRSPIYRSHPELLKFLDVSQFSFVASLGMKGMENFIRKLPGGRQYAVQCFGRRTCCARWLDRYLIVKDTFVAYVRPGDGVVGDVLLMDDKFAAALKEDHVLQICNSSRTLVIQFHHLRQTYDWEAFLNQIKVTKGADFTQPNRFDSFAPIRSQSRVHWLINGEDYMSAVADAIESAKEEIFIADWWLSPEIYLKRPARKGHYWRLDKTLQRKARQGVRVYVLLYKEFSPAVALASLYTKDVLTENSTNSIRVLRHPDRVTDANSTVFWSHHEKLVVVDQKIAFLGGIDLCFGRWDTSAHPIIDAGQAGSASSAPGAPGTSNGARMPSASDKLQKRYRHDGADLYMHDFLSHKSDENSDLSQLGNLVDMIQSTLASGNRPAARWRKMKAVLRANNLHTGNGTDGAAKTNGDAAADNGASSPAAKAVRNWHKLKHTVQVAKPVVSPSATEMEAAIDFRPPPGQDVRMEAAVTCGQLFLGKDYANYYMCKFVQLNQPYDDLVDRQQVPRVPWQDVGVLCMGAIARDVARHFIQRWNFTKNEKAKNKKRYPLLLPKTYDAIPVDEAMLKKGFKCNTQLLRSVAHWSCGSPGTEKSIVNAMVYMIETSQHYLYMESQFFISIAGSNDVTNPIAQKLYDRILKAYHNNETYRVYVIVPLVPTPVPTIVWNFKSISHGDGSLIRRLQRAVGDPYRYIRFFGLRNWAQLNGNLMQSLVYVHSKLVIADDRVVLCGSANINDRSLLGNRDSELALYIEDTEFVKSKMNGVDYQAGRFALSLRQSLMRNHLGGDDALDLSDPVCDHFFNQVWGRIALDNAAIYDRVFCVIPTNHVSNSQEYESRSRSRDSCLAEKKPTEAHEALLAVKGHLVEFPYDFMAKESFEITIARYKTAGLLPLSVWI